MGAGHPSVVNSLQILAVALVSQNRLDEAISECNESLRAARDAGVQDTVVSLLVLLSSLHLDNDDLATAEACSREAFALSLQIKAASPHAAWQLAYVLSAAGKHDEAKPILAQLLPMGRQMLAGNSASDEVRYAFAWGVSQIDGVAEEDLSLGYDAALSIIKRGDSQ